MMAAGREPAGAFAIFRRFKKTSDREALKNKAEAFKKNTAKSEDRAAALALSRRIRSSSDTLPASLKRRYPNVLDDTSPLPIPDLVGSVGHERSIALLRRALRLRASLEVNDNTGKETTQLVQDWSWRRSTR